MDETTAYTASQRDLKLAINRLQFMTGCPIDEATSEADVLWLLNFRRHAPTCEADLHMVVMSTFYDLLDWQRGQRRRRASQFACDPEQGSQEASIPDHIGPGPMWGDASSDALAIVKIITDMPPVLQCAVRRRGGEPRNIRSVLREYLADLDWCAQRISEAFNELREILS